jgi:glucose-6-phosphate isomerase
MDEAWNAVAAEGAGPLLDLFAADPDRLSRFTVEEAGIRFDFSKTHLTADLVSAFVRLAEAQDLAGAREALFSGQAINVTEGRAAEHSAERGQGAPESVARAQGLHARMRALIDAIEAGAFGEIRHVLHIGIGGSRLGPDFLIDALGRDAWPLRCGGGLERRWGGARGSDLGFRSASDLAGHRLQDLHHQRDHAQCPLRPRLA